MMLGQIVYIIIAVTTWYYPNAGLTTSNGRTAGVGGNGTETGTGAQVQIAKMLMK